MGTSNRGRTRTEIIRLQYLKFAWADCTGTSAKH